MRGVHAEYLPDPQGAEARDSGVPGLGTAAARRGRAEETQLTLFSTINLHIFQTYYGGLRPER